MSENVIITPGSGQTIGADQVTDGTLGTASIQYVKIMDGTIAGTNKAAVGATGLKVDGSAVTQPISGTVTVGNASIAVTGTFWQATQPISAASLPLPTGAATESTLSSLNGKVTAVNTGAVTVSTALPAGTNVIGHVIADSGSTTAVTGNVTAVQGTGTNLHTVVDSGSVSVSNFPATQPISGTVTVNAGTGTMLVDGSGHTQPISGSVTVSGTVTSNIGTTNGLALDSSLSTIDTDIKASQPRKLQDGSGTAITSQTSGSQRALDVGIDVAGVQVDPRSIRTLTASDTITAVQAVGTNLHTVIDSGTITVSGTVTANIGTADTIATSTIQTNGTQKTQIVDGSGDIASVSSSTGALMVANVPNNLSVTATGAAAAAVTLTLPAVASQFHYIALIEIQAYSTAARTGGTTPVLVTSTNFPTSNVWTFATGAAVGTTDTKIYAPCSPIRSAVVNTSTTIVCPATTAIIWRVNVFYSTGV